MATGAWSQAVRRGHELAEACEREALDLAEAEVAEFALWAAEAAPAPRAAGYSKHKHAWAAPRVASRGQGFVCQLCGARVAEEKRYLACEVHPCTAVCCWRCMGVAETTSALSQREAQVYLLERQGGFREK
eukprot:TRINITY_DN3465_c0_g1_i1.p3 TRINITY_DN3465_c0_g1~~TRINITY_DN3465_c0_g1_i1.p3  ORF type:complete len:131 (+),score=25.59 TRINITY_DN3465_c0_g1_i1:143-535(+)